MKKHLIAVIALFAPLYVICQDISGLWSGTILNDSTQLALPYEVYIKKVNGKFLGYSYTRFQIDGKHYFGVKKVKARIARDGKIIILDDVLVENNYPVAPKKNIYQLNVLNLVNQGNEMLLDGSFVTNRTKDFNELTGQVKLKKITETQSSSLMQFLNKSEFNAEISSVSFISFPGK